MADPSPSPETDRDADLHARLVAAFRALGPDYRPRTHQIDGNEPRFVNRLIEEPSPYLLQHAHNPVDWWPWGTTALEEAARRDLPVFLSAGYATCHWCHVMEEESFDDPGVAALLNRNFIAIKLDREQRPDIDHLYITATSLQHGHAGWPNSVWMLPDGRPFHTGTYFPKPHFMQILTAIARGWQGGDRSEFERVAGLMAEQLQRLGARKAAQADLADVPQAAVTQLAGYFNPAHGGFGQATQFPHEGYLLFLLDRWRRRGDTDALAMARTTLDGIASGGIHDHVGGGFHRYAVDVNWRTPHFEKMLYNQALLMRCFTELYEISGETAHRRAVQRCADYVLRDMVAPDGAFFAAEDADSVDKTGRLREGAFYLWTPEAVRGVLDEDAGPVIDALGLTAAPTLEEGPVAHLKPGMAVDFAALDPALERLRVAREGRARPLRDEKVIAGWNGLMIRALAEAGRSLGRRDWVDAAAGAAAAVLARLDGPDRLARLSAGGQVREDGNLSDHVWLAEGCLALSDAGAGTRWLAEAERLAMAARERFAVAGGRLALVRDGAPLGPVMENEDGAVPSGESAALELFARLDRRVRGTNWAEAAHALADALSGHIAGLPMVRLVALLGAEVLRGGESGMWRVHEGGALVTGLVRENGHWHLHLLPGPGWHLANGGAAGLPIRVEGAEAALPGATHLAEPVLIPLRPHADVISLTVQLCDESLCLAPLVVTYRQT